MKVIGGGGFASVWRAKTVGPGGFEREAAIKVMRPGRASQKRFQDMLLDEARLVARIQHPNVAQIWEVGEDPRSLYIVMELVDGDSLDDLRVRAEGAEKSLPVRGVFRVLADTCAGLHVAHELSQDGAPLQLVHRDISPQNILVSRHGNAKLIDFGIAKAKERLAADTTTGFIKGKISFMAPEQARSEEVDRRADVWAIGAVAYELIEGRPPCEGASDLGRLAALISPTPVPPLSGAVPEPLRRVVAKTLEKDRDLRYATALELKEAIEEALIESELETSATDVATLFKPFFHSRVSTTLGAPSAPPGAARPESPEPEAGRGGLGDETQGHSVERAVSSTIELRASPGTGTIELPIDRRPLWPFVAGAMVLVVPLALWWTSRAPEPAAPGPRAPASSTQAEPAGSPPPAVSSAPQITPAASTSAAPVASASSDPAPAPSALPVQRPPRSGGGKKPGSSRPVPTGTEVIDENAIE